MKQLPLDQLHESQWQRYRPFDSKNDEDVKCALALDALPELKYWTPNVSRHPNSFSLPTSTDKFYPDFVAVMEDGRLMVVAIATSYSRASLCSKAYCWSDFSRFPFAVRIANSKIPAVLRPVRQARLVQ